MNNETRQYMIDFLLSECDEYEKGSDIKYLSLASDKLIEIAFKRKKEILKDIEDFSVFFKEQLYQELKDNQ